MVMPFPKWTDAAAAIRQAIGRVTATQLELAEKGGISLPKRLPRLVAGARLQTALGPHLGLAPAGLCTFQQLEFISNLRHDSEPILDKLLKEADDPENPFDRREADAWISHLLLKKRLNALE